MSGSIGALIAWSEQLVDRLGYAGLAVVMLLEGLVPPIPSEPILLAAGFASARGSLSAVGAAVAAAAGSTVAATAWFFLGRALPEPWLRALLARYGWLVLLRERDLDTAVAVFDRRRRVAVFVGRFLPVGRMLISLPAGHARMPLSEFLVATFLGSLVWCGVLVGGGVALGEGYPAALRLVARYDAALYLLGGMAALVGLAALVRRKLHAGVGP